jgi:hypothetical protein
MLLLNSELLLDETLELPKLVLEVLLELLLEDWSLEITLEPSILELTALLLLLLEL